MRPLKVSYADLMKATSGMGNSPSPEASKAIVLFLADYLQAFKSAPSSFAGLSCTGTDDKGQPFEFSMGGVETSGMSPGIYPGVTVSNIKVIGNGDTVTLDKFELKQIDFTQPIAAIEAQGDAITPEWMTANYRKVIPAFAGLSFSGFAVNGIDPESPGTTIDAKIASFDLSLSNYLNGIPTKFSTSASGIEAPLPATRPTIPSRCCWRLASPGSISALI